MVGAEYIRYMCICCITATNNNKIVELNQKNKYRQLGTPKLSPHEVYLGGSGNKTYTKKKKNQTMKIIIY